MFTDEQILYLKFNDLSSQLAKDLSKLGLAAVHKAGEWRVYKGDQGLESKAFFQHGFERASRGFTRDELREAHRTLYSSIYAIHGLLTSSGFATSFAPDFQRGERVLRAVGKTLEDRTASFEA